LADGAIQLLYSLRAFILAVYAPTELAR